MSDRNGIAVGRIAVPALCVFQTFEFDDHYLAYRRCTLLGVGPDCTFVDINNFLVHLAGSLNPLDLASGDKGFPLHGPAEGFRHGGIEVGDELFDPLLEMVF